MLLLFIIGWLAFYYFETSEQEVEEPESNIECEILYWQPMETKAEKFIAMKRAGCDYKMTHEAVMNIHEWKY